MVTRAFLRYLVRRRSLSVLQLLGIASGVAAAVGMSLSARAALDSFAAAVAFLRGAATHSLARPAGPIEEACLVRLVGDPAVAAFSPVIDRRLVTGQGESVRVLGVDPFLDRRFRPDVAPGPDASLAFLTEPRAVLADANLATRLGLAEGASLETERGSFQVVGTFPNPSGEPLLLMDIAAAQELFGLRGWLDRVDLVLADPDPFRSRWGDGYEVLSREAQQQTLGQMLRAFRLNLEALSLVGLFVGVFLVYNTAMFAVVSRRRDAGILRSLGASRSELAGAFLAEVLVLGGLGGLLGAALGFWLSHYLTGLVGGAISNVYFFLRPRAPVWSWQVAAVGVLLGATASLVGAAFPLFQLVRCDPVAALRGRGIEQGGARLARRVALWGLAVAAVSAALLPPASQHVYFGFAGVFGLLAAASLASGVGVHTVGPLLQRLCGAAAGLPGRVAAGNLHRNLGRSAVAVAAFGVALAMTIGLGLMVGSFRETLVGWMQGQLTGELYVAPSAEREVPPEFYEAVRRVPGVGGVDPYRNTQILYQDTLVYVSAVRADVLRRFARFHWRDGGDESWQAAAAGAALVSESFQRRFRVGRGDRVELPGRSGPVSLAVGGVFYDYTTEHGVVMLDRSTYLQVFGDPTLDSVGVFLDPDHPDREATIREVQRLASRWNLPVVSRSELHGGILEVFDATFAVTRSMRLIAVVVAFFGIAGALMTLYLERQREFGVYRALGFSTAQVAAMTWIEGLGMGLLSLMLGALSGTLLAFLLIGVINLQSFHWTIFFHPSWVPYGVAAATALAASSGAAGYPVWRVWRTYPQLQIREE